METVDLSAYIKQDKMSKILNIDICEEHVLAFSSQKVFNLSTDCFSLLKEKYNNTARVISKTGDLVIISEGKLLLIERPSNSYSKVDVLGGSHSKITNVTSFSLSDRNIIIVNDHKTVLVFPKDIAGDILPVSIFQLQTDFISESIEIVDNVIKIFAADGIVQDFTIQQK